MDLFRSQPGAHAELGDEALPLRGFSGGYRLSEEAEIRVGQVAAREQSVANLLSALEHQHLGDLVPDPEDGSPTRPSTSPFRICRSTSSTARRSPRLVKNSVFRPRTTRIGSTRYLLARGSRTSRRPSPRRLTETVKMSSAIPGIKIVQGWLSNPQVHPMLMRLPNSGRKRLPALNPMNSRAAKI